MDSLPLKLSKLWNRAILLRVKFRALQRKHENLEKRIKALEQDYPNEEELKKLRREGTN